MQCILHSLLVFRDSSAINFRADVIHTEKDLTSELRA